MNQIKMVIWRNNWILYNFVAIGQGHVLGVRDRLKRHDKKLKEGIWPWFDLILVWALDRQSRGARFDSRSGRIIGWITFFSTFFRQDNLLQSIKILKNFKNNKLSSLVTRASQGFISKSHEFEFLVIHVESMWLLLPTLCRLGCIGCFWIRIQTPAL